MKMIRHIEDYQLKELQDEMLYINIYSLEVKYTYELSKYWKELFFDILQALTENDYEFHSDFLNKQSLFNYMKEQYKFLIEYYNLNIDIKDYVEINDYISYKEWTKNPDNGIGFFGKDIYLITKTVEGEI